MMTYILIAIGAVLVVLLCIGLAIASFAGENYFRALEEARTKRNTCDITTLEFVNQINEKHFNGKLRLTECPEHSDHYSGGTVALSRQTMNSNSLASMATISHELGHARQDATGDTLKKHFKLRKSVFIASLFFMPLTLSAIVIAVLHFVDVLPETMFLYVAIGCAGLALLIFLFTLFLKYKEIKVEKEASTFALDYLREYFTEPEVKICKDFLDSARLTYWAVLFKSMLGWTMLTKKK